MKELFQRNLVDEHYESDAKDARKIKRRFGETNGEKNGQNRGSGSPPLISDWGSGSEHEGGWRTEGIYGKV